MIDLRLPRTYWALILLTASIIPRLCTAQAAPAGSSLPNASRFELFGGYGYFHPFNSSIYNQPYDPIPGGVVAGATGFFNRYVGLQAEYTHFYNSPDYCLSTVQGGPVFRRPVGRFVPFAHIVGGGAQVGPSYLHNGSSNGCTWGWAATGGVGIDYVLAAPGLGDHLAIRPIQADFHYSDVTYSNQLTGSSYTGGEGQITAFRLSAGLVYRIGSVTPALPASYGCEAQPVTVYPGDPVTVTGRVINLEESKRLLPVYTWSSTGGRITGSAGGATIATADMAPGDYSVTGHVNEGSQPSRHADCSTTFRVLAYEPPTIACAANPATVQPGGFATITSTGRSPQNRRLTYSYSSSAGQVSVTGTTGTLTTSGVNPGLVNITCNVVDDLGKSAAANTSVTIVAPPPPPPAPAPTSSTLCSISFERDRKRPVRVDNEAKACLDDVAIEMNRASDAVLVVVGKHDPQETPDAAAERTLNVKQYLTEEKGIDPSRIELRTGESTGRTVDNIVVPPGASWDTGGTTSFDPSRVQRHGQPYAPAPKAAAHK